MPVLNPEDSAWITGNRTPEYGTITWPPADQPKVNVVHTQTPDENKLVITIEIDIADTIEQAKRDIARMIAEALKAL